MIRTVATWSRSAWERTGICAAMMECFAERRCVNCYRLSSSLQAEDDVRFRSLDLSDLSRFGVRSLSRRGPCLTCIFKTTRIIQLIILSFRSSVHIMQTDDASNLFQTDAALAKSDARRIKAQRASKIGDPISLPSKVLALQVRGQDAWVAESGWVARRVNLTVSTTTQSASHLLMFCLRPAKRERSLRDIMARARRSPY